MELALSLFPVSSAETTLGLVGSARSEMIAMIDSEDASRELLGARARRAGLRVREYGSPLALAARLDDDPACILLVDHGASEASLDFIRLMEREVKPPPIVAVVMDSSPTCVVRLLRAGAHAAIGISASPSELVAAVDDAISAGRARSAKARRRSACRRRIDTLLAGELDVFRAVITGALNKAIARQLNVSVRTVENWRRLVYEKIGVESVAQLVAFAYYAEDDRLTLWSPPMSDELCAR